MKVVFQGKIKSGKEIIIRYPEMFDLEKMLNYINTISDERTFITYQGEHETLKSEKEYLEGRIKAIKNKEAVQLMAFYNKELIGVADIRMGKRTGRHIGTLGVTIAKDFRNEGLGKTLMKLIEEEALKNFPNIQMIILNVFSSNVVARNLYQKSGFIQYGLLPNGISRSDSFEDELMMCKKVKK